MKGRVISSTAPVAVRRPSQRPPTRPSVSGTRRPSRASYRTTSESYQASNRIAAVLRVRPDDEQAEPLAGFLPGHAGFLGAHFGPHPLLEDGAGEAGGVVARGLGRSGGR